MKVRDNSWREVTENRQCQLVFDGKGWEKTDDRQSVTCEVCIYRCQIGIIIFTNPKNQQLSKRWSVLLKSITNKCWWTISTVRSVGFQTQWAPQPYKEPKLFSIFMIKLSNFNMTQCYYQFHILEKKREEGRGGKWKMWNMECIICIIGNPL